MLKILVFVSILGIALARPGGHGLGVGLGGLGYGGNALGAAPLPPAVHTVLAPITVSAGISHTSRVDYPSPVTAVVATGPAVAVGYGLGLGYGLGGHGLVGHGHY